MSQSLDELTQKVRAVSDTYAERCNIRRDPDWYVLKLSEELGELTAEVLRNSGRGRVKDGNGRKALADETADLLAHVLLFADAEGIDLEEALADKWFRYLSEDANS